MFMWGGSAPRSNPLPYTYHFSCKKATLSQTFPPPGKCYDKCIIWWVKIYASDGWNLIIHHLSKKGQVVSFLSVLTKTKLQTVIMTGWLRQYCYSTTDSLKNTLASLGLISVIPLSIW